MDCHPEHREGSAVVRKAIHIRGSFRVPLRYDEKVKRSFMASAEVNRMLAVAAAACEDKKAEDIRILALDPTESGLTDYFLICTGMSDRQNVAITDEIELQLKRQFGVYPNSVEGRRQGEWILMDYVDFIVHVFSVEKRAYYGLERLRKSATLLSIADLNAQLATQIKAAVAARSPKKSPAKTLAAKPARKKAAKTRPKAAAKKVVAKKSAVKKKATKKPAAKSKARRK
jgi:ribosome-associated protein